MTHTDESKKERGWLHWRSGRFSAFDSLARQRKLTSVCSQGVQLARYGPSQVPNMNQINGWEQLRERGMGTMMCLSPSSAKVRARQKQICSSGWAENKPGGQKQINNRIWTRRKTRLKSSPTIFQANHRSRSFWMISLQILLVDLEVVDGCEGTCETLWDISLCGDCVIFGWMCCGWRRRQLCSTTSGCRAASSHPLLTSGSSSDLPAVGAREAGKGLPLTEEKPRSQHVVDVR